MFCSHCGKPLGQTAHILNDQLLCDDCFALLGSPHGPALTSSSPLPPTVQRVQVGNVDEEDRRKISEIPEAQPEAMQTPVQQQHLQTPPVAPSQQTAVEKQKKLELTPAMENVLLQRAMLPGESILWQRSFSKGLLNRHLTCTEVVTSLKAIVIDDENLSILRFAPLKSSVVTVDNQHRSYSGVHAGVSRYGAYTGTSTGQSVTYGNVNFIQNGAVVLTLYNVSDPHGLKNLITAAQKSMTR